DPNRYINGGRWRLGIEPLQRAPEPAEEQHFAVIVALGTGFAGSYVDATDDLIFELTEPLEKRLFEHRLADACCELHRQNLLSPSRSPNPLKELLSALSRRRVRRLVLVDLFRQGGWHFEEPLLYLRAQALDDLVSHLRDLRCGLAVQITNDSGAGIMI